MKTLTKMFILGEILDLATTAAGIYWFGLSEGNPLVGMIGWPLTLMYKFILDAALVVLFEWRYHWAEWFPVFFSWFTVCSNLRVFMIVA